MNFIGFGFLMFGFGGNSRQAKNFLYVKDGSGKTEQFVTSDGKEFIVKRG